MKIFIPENNLGQEASHMMDMLKNHNDVRTFYQKKDEPGVRKGPETADYYVYRTAELMRTNSLRFSIQLFTNTHNQTAATAKTELQHQLERYHVELKRARTEFEKTRRVVTGKCGPAVQDDLVIATMQGIFFGPTASMAPSSCLV
jgi:hypothetical protein